ncbi:hypothetical protein [Streptomyces sp. NPDC001652]|uniref:hypothetical protein n=1 Tax=Streptomyces sp. NPDC001652 TaxID=3154393 RepID=UPI0033322689
MSERAVLILLTCALTIVIAAALTAAVAGYLARRDHATYPAALARAAVAFGATLSLATAITTTLIQLGG